MNPTPPSDALGRLRMIRESQHDTDRPGPIIEDDPQDVGELALRRLKVAETRRLATESHLATEVDRVANETQGVSLVVERLDRAVTRLEEIVSSMQGDRLDVHKKLDEHTAALVKQGQIKYWLVAGLTIAEAFRESGAAKVIGGILKALGN